MNDIKLYIKRQLVTFHDTSITGCFINLYPDINILLMQRFMHIHIKNIIKQELIFAMVSKLIFNGLS